MTDLSEIMTKFMSMMELLELCILFLSHHEVLVQSRPIMPQLQTLQHAVRELVIDQFSQDAAESILRTMILDREFARSIYSELDDCMAILVLEKHDPTTRISPEQQQSASATNNDSCSSLEKSGHFCCAVVLLAGIIGKRAEYLLSQEDVDYCERNREHVYLS